MEGHLLDKAGVSPAFPSRDKRSLSVESRHCFKTLFGFLGYVKSQGRAFVVRKE